jgi:hypothetical protein
MPSKHVFFGVFCSYWTDDVKKLKPSSSGIAVCPHCERLMTLALRSKWDRDVKEVAVTRPGYDLFVARNKEHCYGDRTIESVMEEIASAN